MNITVAKLGHQLLQHMLAECVACFIGTGHFVSSDGETICDKES
jgi:hypothetical protein